MDSLKKIIGHRGIGEAVQARTRAHAAAAKGMSAVNRYHKELAHCPGIKHMSSGHTMKGAYGKPKMTKGY